MPVKYVFKSDQLANIELAHLLSEQMVFILEQLKSDGFEIRIILCFQINTNHVVTHVGYYRCYNSVMYLEVPRDQHLDSTAPTCKEWLINILLIFKLISIISYQQHKPIECQYVARTSSTEQLNAPS